MAIISVITPTYNNQATIALSIESLLNQTFTNFELIIINDGSQDATLDIVSKIQDSRIKIFSYPNSGSSVSRNRGISHAVGEFISFLDADDLWTPDKLSSQLSALYSNPNAAVAYSWTDHIDDDGKFLCPGTHVTASGDVLPKLLVMNFIENGSNPLIRREALIAVGEFDPSLVAGQDWDMWLRLAARYHFVAVPSPQILYRISHKSHSSNLPRQQKYCVQLLDRAFSQAPASLQHLKPQSMANLYKYLTWKAVQEPYQRQKCQDGARFLWKYVAHDSGRFQHLRLTLILLFKIVVVLLLPANQASLFLNNIKKIRRNAIT